MHLVSITNEWTRVGSRSIYEYICIDKKYIFNLIIIILFKKLLWYISELVVFGHITVNVVSVLFSEFAMIIFPTF